MLFGSLARDNYTPYSDIDVICVYEEEFDNPKERFHRSYKFSNGLVQPITLSLEELKKGLKEGNSFLHHIFDEGIILYSTIDEKTIASWKEEGAGFLDIEYYSTY